MTNTFGYVPVIRNLKELKSNVLDFCSVPHLTKEEFEKRKQQISSNNYDEGDYEDYICGLAKSPEDVNRQFDSLLLKISQETRRKRLNHFKKSEMEFYTFLRKTLKDLYNYHLFAEDIVYYHAREDRFPVFHRFIIDIYNIETGVGLVDQRRIDSSFDEFDDFCGTGIPPRDLTLYSYKSSIKEFSLALKTLKGEIPKNRSVFNLIT